MEMTILLGIAVVGFLLWEVKKAVERPQKIKEAKEAAQRQQELERVREEVEERDRNLQRRVEGLIEAEENRRRLAAIDAFIDRRVAPSVHKLDMAIKEFTKFKPNKDSEDAVFGYLQSCSDRTAQLKQRSAKKIYNELSDEIAKSKKANKYIQFRFNSIGDALTWNAQYEATCALGLFAA